MYQPSHFEECRLDVLHRLLSEFPLGALVTHGADGLCADHIPFEIGAPTPQAPLGVLRGHVARANPLAQQAGRDALLIFQGPHSYITPAWYVEKQVSGKVVPTYNYAVVHAHGLLHVIDDAQWLQALLGRLTARHEAAQMQPWSLSDAPPEYIERMLTAIVGIEIPLARIEGKWKTSQNRSESDRERIAAGLQQQGETAMADLVRFV
jgi:transcriptional regulator